MPAGLLRRRSRQKAGRRLNITAGGHQFPSAARSSAAESLDFRFHFPAIFWTFTWRAQASRMSPLLIAVLTAAISLSMAILAGL